MLLLAPRSVPPTMMTSAISSSDALTHLGVDIPPLPDGRRLDMLEGFDLIAPAEVSCPLTGGGNWEVEQDGIDTSIDDLDGLLSVGGTVWPCAAALCRWLHSHQEDLQGANVLELGAGTGVCGLYAAALGGASQVVLTDGEPSLLKLQQANLERNAELLRPPPVGSGWASRVAVSRLQWAEDAPPTPRRLTSNSDASAGEQQDVPPQPSATSSPSRPSAWDLVIGSDVTYTNSYEALAVTLAALLASDDDSKPPRIVLSHEHRNRGAASFAPTPSNEPCSSSGVLLVGEVSAAVAMCDGQDGPRAMWGDSDTTIRRFTRACRQHNLEVVQLHWERQRAGDAEGKLMAQEREVSIIEVKRAADSGKVLMP